MQKAMYHSTLGGIKLSEKISEIADRIRELREVSGISAGSLAEKLNIPADLYMRYENAEESVPISTLYQIAGILRVDMTN